MTTAEVAIENLRHFAVERRDARALYRQKHGDLAVAVVHAADAGIPYKQITRESGLARETVYAVLRRAGRRP